MEKMNFENLDIVLFPREKKTNKSPDFSGSISQGRDQKIGDVIFYNNTTKTGTKYLRGYLFLGEDKVGVNIEVKSQQYDDPVKPAIVGTIKIDGVWMKLAMWQKNYAKGDYYSGKIGSVVLAG